MIRIPGNASRSLRLRIVLQPYTPSSPAHKCYRKTPTGSECLNKNNFNQTFDVIEFSRCLCIFQKPFFLYETRRLRHVMTYSDILWPTPSWRRGRRDPSYGHFPRLRGRLKILGTVYVVASTYRVKVRFPLRDLRIARLLIQCKLNKVGFPRAVVVGGLNLFASRLIFYFQKKKLWYDTHFITDCWLTLVMSFDNESSNEQI